jgi:hypothetical protein
MKYLFVSILFFGSCATTYRPIKPTNHVKTIVGCEALEAYLTKNWFQHRDKKYYQFSEDFKTQFIAKFYKCLIQLNQAQVKSLFGVPYEADKDFLYYWVGQECTTPLKKGCYFLTFVFNEPGLVRSVDIQWGGVFD